MISQFLRNIGPALLTGCLLWGSPVHGQQALQPPVTANMDPAAPHLQVGVMDLDIPLNDLVQAIVRDAYLLVGRIPRFERYPPRRSLMLAGSGELDAELFRVRQVELLHPALVRVDFPLYTVEAIAYALNPGLPIFSCEDLQDYKVGVTRGIVLMEQCAKGARQTIRAPNPLTLTDLLLQGRVDVIVTEQAMGDIIVMPSAPGQISPLPKPLLSVPVYHYLHQKNAALAAPLKEALQQLNREGSLAAREMQWRIRQIPTAAGKIADSGDTATPAQD